MLDQLFSNPCIFVQDPLESWRPKNRTTAPITPITERFVDEQFEEEYRVNRVDLGADEDIRTAGPYIDHKDPESLLLRKQAILRRLKNDPAFRDRVRRERLNAEAFQQERERSWRLVPAPSKKEEVTLQPTRIRRIRKPLMRRVRKPRHIAKSRRLDILGN